MSIFDGKRILVVEDEPLVGMMLEEIVRDAGADVIGPVASMAEALALVAREKIDAASLDINLAGHASFPVADALQARGVPYFFATGYGDVARPTAHAHALIVRKPFQTHQVLEALRWLLAR